MLLLVGWARSGVAMARVAHKHEYQHRASRGVKKLLMGNDEMQIMSKKWFNGKDLQSYRTPRRCIVTSLESCPVGKYFGVKVTYHMPMHLLFAK